jgi:uncharacterized protein YaiE (UPF0345 family)
MDICINKGFLNYYNSGSIDQQSYDYKGEQAALSGASKQSFQIKEIEAYQCK